MTLPFLQVSACLLLFATFGFAQPVPIWNNPITGSNPGASNPYTTGDMKHANITVSGIGQTGLNNISAADRYNFDDWGTGTAINPGKYFSFSLTPSTGYKMSLSNFVYTGTRETNSGGNAGPTSFAFRSSADAYATDIGVSSDAGANIGLGAATYQNLSSVIQFRFYGWNGGSNGDYSINDFTFNGSVLGSGTTSLSGFSYVYAAGPSSAQSFTVNGAGLATPTALVTINGSTNYEVSTSSASTGFGATATLAATGGSINGQTVWVRLKAGLPAGNYNETLNFGGGGVNNIPINVTGAVTKATLTVTANNQTKVYGTPNPALTVSYSGFVAGDNTGSLATQPTASTTALTSSPVGTYPITVSGGVSANYNFVYVAGTLTVTKATLTVTADDKSKVYGTANPPLTVN